MSALNLSEDVLALNPELRGKAGRAKAVRVGAYRSKLEAKAAESWCPLIFARGWMYEAITLHLPGQRYTPDFFGRLRDTDLLAVVEVKGWNQNLRADRTKFRAAVEVHTWLAFCWLTWDRLTDRWVEQWHNNL